MRNVELHRSGRADRVKEERHQRCTHDATHDHLVASYACPDEQDSTK